MQRHRNRANPKEHHSVGEFIMDYNAGLNDAYVLLRNRAEELHILETKTERAGNIIASNQYNKAALELRWAALRLVEMKQK